MRRYSAENHPSVSALKKLREKMSEASIDWIIIFSGDPHLSEYLAECDRKIEAFSGFTGSAGTLLVGSDECYLWTDSRYFIQGDIELEGSEITLMKDRTEGTLSLKEFLATHVWEGQCVGFDFKNICFRDYVSLKAALGSTNELIDVEKLISDSLLIKIPRVFNEILAFSEKTAGKSVAEKLDDVRSYVRQYYVRDEEQSFSYIISDTASIMWLFNLRGNDIEYVPVAYSYCVINAFEATIYLSKKSISDGAKDVLNGAGVIIRPYSEFYNDIREIASDNVLLDPFRNNALLCKVFFEKKSLFEIDENKLIKKYIKNESEVEGMKNAGIKDGVVMCRFIKKIKQMAREGSIPNEYETGKMLDEMRISGGCSDLSFATICAYGKNAAIVHYEANEEVHSDIEPKGFLLVDSGGQYAGEGTTDITRTISLGELSDSQKSAYTAVLKGNLRLMNIIFPKGLRGENIDIIAKQPLWEKGLDFYHGTGHGVGCNLEVHEKGVSIKSVISEVSPIQPTFAPGMVTSNEPGVYMEGDFGIRLENMILCVEVPDESKKLLGFEAITFVPFDLEAICFEEMLPEDICILNKYHRLVYNTISPFLNEEEKEWLKEATREV